TLLEIAVKCESNSQYVGMAKYDLYLLDDEGDFRLNFFKCAVGVWLRLCIVIGLAVTASTYLSGVISFLWCMFLLILGYFQDFIRNWPRARPSAAARSRRWSSWSARRS